MTTSQSLDAVVRSRARSYGAGAHAPGGTLGIRRLNISLTLVALMLAITIAGILLILVVTTYQGYRERVENEPAIADVMALSASITEFKADFNRLPTDLAEIGKDSMRDPWDTPYQYVNHSDPNGKFRKDKNIHPINTDFDLWSNGKDRASVPPLTAKPSRDDIIRANDGKFIGLASDYDP